MRWVVGVLLVAVFCASSCGKKPEPPTAQPGAGTPAAPGEGKEAQEPRGIGDDVRDFADYATGRKPLEHQRQIKRKLRKIQDDYNKKLEEQLGK
jgi:hypothetical protein